MSITEEEIKGGGSMTEIEETNMHLTLVLFQLTCKARKHRRLKQRLPIG